jgi:hypothetical protein
MGPTSASGRLAELESRRGGAAGIVDRVRSAIVVDIDLPGKAGIAEPIGLQIRIESKPGAKEITVAYAARGTKPADRAEIAVSSLTPRRSRWARGSIRGSGSTPPGQVLVLEDLEARLVARRPDFTGPHRAHRRPLDPPISREAAPFPGDRSYDSRSSRVPVVMSFTFLNQCPLA